MRRSYYFLHAPRRSEGQVDTCGLYLVAGPDQLIEITVEDIDVNCEDGLVMVCLNIFSRFCSFKIELFCFILKSLLKNQKSDCYQIAAGLINPPVKKT
jgi:hypothetical protein